MDLSSSNKSNIPITNPDHLCAQDFFCSKYLPRLLKYLEKLSLLMYNYSVDSKETIIIGEYNENK